jgi:steroid 5-alpha reductase family enzyme
MVSFPLSGKHDPKAWPGSRINWTREDAKRGFVTRGLWAWSRHPNFACEQLFWCLQNLIPLLAPQPPSLPLHPSSLTSFWPLTPAILICALFASSTAFTESITKSKYRVHYTAYQRRVAKTLPFMTPVWGLWLKINGNKEKVEDLVWGKSRVE